MNKMKKVFAVVSSCIIAACCGMGAVKVSAEEKYVPDEFDDWDYFYEMNKSILYRHAHPKKLMRLPIFRQTTSYTCGVACVLSLLRYAKYDFDISEKDLAAALGSNEKEGTNARPMIDYLNSVKYRNEDTHYFNAELRQGMTIDDLKSEIDSGHPVVCAIQAWNWDENGEYTMDLDYRNDWESGHWAIAIGYNKGNIFFMDPSTAGNYTYIPNDKLMERWHDYEGTTRETGVDVIQAGIVVELCSGEAPDCEIHNDDFYYLGTVALPPVG